MKRIALGFLATVAIQSYAAEVIPPKPERYFDDYAGVVSKSAASRFNEQLAQFERETSNQIVVAVFPKMQSDSDIADYTQRVAQVWGVGQKDRRNGAVLFVFIQDRKMFIQVGYGLEGALPDATGFDITEYHIKPHFKAVDYEGGLATGIDLIQKAVRGEYKGSGKTVADTRDRKEKNAFGGFFLFLIILFFLARIFSSSNRRRGWGYSSGGGPFLGGWSSGGSSGGWSSSSSDSGFSGGGGSFGGGGAGSSW